MVLEKILESSLVSKEIKPTNPKGNQYSLERLMLKLKLQDFGHLVGRTDSLEKTLVRGKIEGKVWWWLDITDSMDRNLSKLWEIVKDIGVWHAAAHGVTKSWI